MKNVSIYGKKWLDLVFEGKNKEYGAYQLRQESQKTSVIALLFGISFLFGFVVLLSSFTEKAPVIIPDEVIKITPVDVVYPVTEPNKPLASTPKQTETKPEVEKATGQMVVTKTENSTPEIPKTPELATVPSPINGTPNGTAPNDGNTGTGTSLIPTNPSKPDGPIAAKELDRQPTYPGGIKKFYEFVGENFDKDNIEEGQTVKINVSFVIEKNGSMTDIKVLETTSPTISKEAIRLLKSLRTKWSPGYKDGQPVRAYFTLPITVLI